MTISCYDVIIVGAGPAGTAAGYDLALSGLSVLLLDRQDFPRKKACAGGITPKAMALFAYDISSLVAHTCRTVKIRRPGGRSFVIGDHRPLCYMTQRRDLDLYSLNKVIGAGGRFLKIEKIISLDQDARGVTLCYGRGAGAQTVRARYLIGADGANSRVRTLLKGRKIPIGRCPALEADVRVDRPGDFSLEFDFSRGIPGYYWIFPRQDHVNIGIFGARPGVKMNRDLLGDYARERLGRDRLEAVKGYPIGVGHGRACAGRGRVILAGDAGGFAESLFGEGIYFALKSGQLAAEAVMGDGMKAYRRSLIRLTIDLGLHGFGARVLYRYPGPCLGLARHSFFHTPFSRGYAAGKTISQIFFPF